MPEDPEVVFELQPAGDGSPKHSSATETASEPIPNLLTMEEDEAGKEMVRDWNASHRFVKPFMEQWRVNVYRSRGYTGVGLVKKQDDMQAYVPAGARPDMAGMNKAARRKRQLRAALFADAAVPECVPSTDEDEDRNSAEFATRLLQNQCSQDVLDYNLLCGDLFDLGSDYGSGFLHFYVDPNGGGWRPAEIVGDAIASQESQPWPLGKEGREQYTTTWYIREDGALTDDRADRNLRKVWSPGLKHQRLTGRNFRFLPHTATDLWDADGCMIGAMVPWGTVRRMFPTLQELPEAEIQGRILTFRPQQSKELFQNQKDLQPERQDDRLVFVLSRYHVQSALYERGAYLVVVGDGLVAHRQEWYDELHGEPLDLPVTQFGQLNCDGNPYYEGIMQYLGPGNEARSQMVGTMFEHLDKFQNRKIFAPMVGPAYPWLLQAPAGTPIPTIPGYEPKYEDLPDFPVIVEKMFAFINEDMDDEVNMSGAIRGLSQPGVHSGIDRQTIIEQALIMLSEFRQRTLRGITRGWRIMLQLYRAYYTEAQLLKYEGDDGAYKVRHWTQADLGSTRDVRLMQGSFTGLSPSAKAAQAQSLFQMGALSQPRLVELLTASVGGTVGLQQDPHRMRVRRQIASWKDGPPKDWQPAEPPTEMDPEMGQVPESQPPDPLADPVLASIFAPSPADEEPLTAQLRMYELGRALASSRTARFPQPWLAGLEAAYVRARQAAGVQTMAELQQAAQQQAQTQQQDREQKATAAQQATQARLQADQLRSGTDLQKAKITAEAELQKTETQMAAKREGEALDVVAAQS
jgi:hypothetical protein